MSSLIKPHTPHFPYCTPQFPHISVDEFSLSKRQFSLSHSSRASPSAAPTRPRSTRTPTASATRTSTASTASSLADHPRGARQGAHALALLHIHLVQGAARLVAARAHKGAARRQGAFHHHRTRAHDTLRLCQLALHPRARLTRGAGAEGKKSKSRIIIGT